MFCKRLLLVTAIGIITGGAWHSAQAGDLRIPLPQRSKFTRVQQLNREGVAAIRRHRYEKAKALFYKAYLFDPDDPFTLNNLGYIAELDGKLESSEHFYSLASQRATNAVIDKSSSSQMNGRLVKDVLSSAGDLPMQTNRANVEAIRLLSKERAVEAEILLRRTLSMDPRNAFTLNNMGVAKEMEGEFEEAARYYTAAADVQSPEVVLVSLDKSWYGKLVSEMAASNTRKMRDRLRQLQTEEGAQAKAARLSLRGVAAINRNDLADARQYFQGAYALDPDYAFSLNNIGFLAEMDGDLETANDYYARAREGTRSDARVGLATSRPVEGMKLSAVADENGQQMESRMALQQEAKRRQKRQVHLQERNNKPIVEPKQPPGPSKQDPQEQKPIS